MGKSKRFTLKKRLPVYFGLLSIFSICVISFIAVNQATAVLEAQIHTNLTTIVEDQAKIFSEKYIASPRSNLETLAHCDTIYREDIPIEQKMAFLMREVARNTELGWLRGIYGNNSAYLWYTDGKSKSGKKKEWVQVALSGKFDITPPHTSERDYIIYKAAVPVYGEDNRINGVLAVEYDASQMSKDIGKIDLGRGGKLFVLDAEGTVIAEPDAEKIKADLFATKEAAKNNTGGNSSSASTSEKEDSFSIFKKKAIASSGSGFDFYLDNKGVRKTAAYTKIPETDWTLVAYAEEKEFMGSIYHLIRLLCIAAGACILIVMVIIIFISKKISTPLVSTAEALKNIAEGEGDLTVSLPMHGNDEISDISLFFNKTIEKLRKSIGSVGKHSNIMEDLGNSLAVSMTKTALSIDEIRASIVGVQEEALKQTESVSETKGTVKRIIGNIESLNGNIENQAASVMRSSSSIEEMVANIDSITQSLEKSNALVKTLADATAEGKRTLLNSNSVTQKIIEQSGGLLEASSVIQNIAEQTNLLAMNAAIEAAHAGESGKGFAVVADEIRKLAEESSVQGKTITETLKHLSDEITTLSSSTQIVEEKFNAIFQLSENVRSMSAELTQAMHEQEKGSREVLDAIKHISAITADVKSGSQEMLTGGRGIFDEMHKLDELTLHIKDLMNEMSNGALQISTTVQEVDGLAQKNDLSIKKLVHEVKKFKV